MCQFGSSLVVLCVNAARCMAGLVSCAHLSDELTPPGGDRPSDVLEQAKVRKAQGFTKVKMNATESIGWLDSPHALDETVKRLAEVKSIGLDAGLDFHGRVHKAMAKQLAQQLEPHRPLFIEEPLLPGHVNELKDLYNKTTIPIAVRLSPVTITTTTCLIPERISADIAARRAAVYTSRRPAVL